MILKTKLFQESCKTILGAVDKTIANLELITVDNFLHINITNKEYYVSLKYLLETPESFHAVVNATLFLTLISGITSEEFRLTIKRNSVVVEADKSKYSLAMIYENDALMVLPEISLTNKTVEMPIKLDILKSIANVNSKELLKVKNIDVNELQKLYFIDETGCFTFTTGACLNSFQLDKPIKLLLNDRIVKLFKLFDADVSFSFGYDDVEGVVEAKAIFETDNVRLVARITTDDILISKIQGPCNATKKWIAMNYKVEAVLSVTALAAAVSRILLFTKNSDTNANLCSLPVELTFNKTYLTIKDKLDNQEVIQIENDSNISEDYTLTLNLYDLKLVLDSCKEDHITMNCGNNRSVILTRGVVSNLIPECVVAS